jgi:glycosyltransferase involved in cell wall biosynthesis
MEKIPLSVVIPVYNEERFIAKCLESVQWADEIIVVDGGSKDCTLEIAKKYATRILSTENAPAETQRLKGLREIKHSWFLLLDADERVSSDLRGQIAAVLKAVYPKAAYYVLRRNYYRGRAVHLHHPDYQLRLFQKNQISSLPDKIHRIPQIQGETGILQGELIHRFFTSTEDYLKKLIRYTAIEASYAECQDGKSNAFQIFKRLFLRPIGRFIQYYFLKGGFRDGFFGFFYSASSAYYDFVVAASLLIKPDDTDS